MPPNLTSSPNGGPNHELGWMPSRRYTNVQPVDRRSREPVDVAEDARSDVRCCRPRAQRTSPLLPECDRLAECLFLSDHEKTGCNSNGPASLVGDMYGSASRLRDAGRECGRIMVVRCSPCSP